MRSRSRQTAAQDEIAQTCVFAWPRYDEGGDLDALMGDYGKLLADRSGLMLCLRHDPSVDGDIALELPNTRGRRRQFIEDLGARRVESPAELQRALRPST